MSYPTLTQLRDSTPPSRAALRVCCGATTAVLYASRHGGRVADARQSLDAAVMRGELTRDVFGVYSLATHRGQRQRFTTRKTA